MRDQRLGHLVGFNVGDGAQLDAAGFEAVGEQLPKRCLLYTSDAADDYLTV